jgi:hypothetical protein
MIGQDAYNAEIIKAYTVPWLQDSTQVNVSNRWHVGNDGVFVILDAGNRPVAVYDLFALQFPGVAAYDTLKARLLKTARS